MAVCQFFLRGHCRYGDKCWNEHPRGGGGAQRSLTFGGDSQQSGGSGSNQFKWVNPSRPGAKGDGAPASALDLVMALPTEMQTWHKSGMWPFSSIALEKNTPSLPEFEDLSPEELRAEAYSAQQSNTFQKYVEKVKQLGQEWSTKKQQLAALTPDLKQKLIRFLEEARTRSSTQSSAPGFGGTGAFGASATPGGFGAGTAKPSPFALPSSGGTSTFGSTGSTPGTFGTPGTSSSFGGSGTFGGGSGTAGFGSAGTGGAFGSAATGGLFGKGQGAGGLFGGTSASGAFGSPAVSAAPPPAAGSGGFGSQPGAGLGLFSKGLGALATALGAGGFGAAGTGSFGAGSGGIFGGGSGGFGAQPQPASAAGTSLFGKPSAAAGLFSAPSSSAAGPGNAPGSGLFSATPSAQPFGAPASTGGGLPFGGGGVTGTFGGSSGQGSTNLMTAGQQPGQSGAAGLFGGGLRAPTQESQPQSEAQVKKMETLGEVSRMYTPVDEVSPGDLEQFMAPSFTIGKIPMVPPPRELINN